MSRARFRALAALAALLLPTPVFLASAEGAEGLEAGSEPLRAADMPISIAGEASASFALWESRGSALAPAIESPASSSSVRLDLRVEAGELSRCATELSFSADAASSSYSFEARELWAELRPWGFLSFRAGRQRLGLGSGYGWNPCDDLDPERYATDASLPRTGADAAQLRLEAADWAGFPLSLFLVARAPQGGSSPSLADGKLGAQLYALAGVVELMLLGSLSDPGGDSESYLLGAWTTLPLGPLVLGLEASLRRRSDLYRPGPGGLPLLDEEAHGQAVATATLRSGDFILIGEAYWNGAAYGRDELELALSSPYAAAYASALLAPGSVGAYHGLCRILWSSGDWSASAGAVADLETGAFVASVQAELALQGEASLSLEAALPASSPLLERDELGLSGRGCLGRAAVSVHF